MILLFPNISFHVSQHIFHTFLNIPYHHLFYFGPLKKKLNADLCCFLWGWFFTLSHSFIFKNLIILLHLHIFGKAHGNKFPFPFEHRCQMDIWLLWFLKDAGIIRKNMEHRDTISKNLSFSPYDHSILWFLFEVIQKHEENSPKSKICVISCKRTLKQSLCGCWQHTAVHCVDVSNT